MLLNRGYKCVKYWWHTSHIHYWFSSSGESCVNDKYHVKITEINFIVFWNQCYICITNCKTKLLCLFFSLFSDCQLYRPLNIKWEMIVNYELESVEVVMAHLFMELNKIWKTSTRIIVLVARIWTGDIQRQSITFFHYTTVFDLQYQIVTSETDVLVIIFFYTVSCSATSENEQYAGKVVHWRIC
jgi:hypothetical protein